MTLNDLPDGRLLVYGIGNVGRQDDGVGPMLVERLAATGCRAAVTFESGYQLAPEDALLLSAHQCVLFIDATVAQDAPAPYAVDSVVPASEVSFTSHALSAGALLTLCRRLYGCAPHAYSLAIPAYSFDINADVSPQAAENLESAFADLSNLLVARHSG